MLYMALFRNNFLIALSNFILCQVEGIRAIIVSDLISGTVSDVHKNSTFKHFLPLVLWMVRLMMSDLFIIVGVTLII